MAQYFRIATKDFCNTLKPGSFTGDTMMCPTRSQIESAGLHIKKGYTYAADQLVPEDHIERLDWEYTFSVTPATATISAAGGSRKFTVTSYKRQYSYSNAGNRIYVEGSQTDVAYTGSNLGSGIWTSGTDTISFGANPGGGERTGTITWTQSESFGSAPKKTATATYKQNADTISSYDYPVVDTFSYPVIPAGGGTVSPSYTYHQVVHWVSGRTTTLTSGGSLSFVRNSGTATINSSGGSATQSSKGTVQSNQTTVANVTLTVSMNGKSGSRDANVNQALNRIENTSWNSWNVYVDADKTSFPREGGTTTVRAGASRSGTHTWSSGSTSSAGDSGTPSLSLSNTSGFSLSSSSGTTVTLTVSANNGSARSTVITASYGDAEDTVTINQKAGILTDTEYDYRYNNICSVSISNTGWSWNDTSKRSFSVDSRRGTSSRYRTGTSTDGGNTWNWGDWSDWSGYSYTNISATSSVTGPFSISGSTVGPDSNNTGTSSRSGTLKASNAYTSDSITLTQGINVEYDYQISVSPGSYNFGASGGSTSFTVTPQTREGSGSPISWGNWYDSPSGSYNLNTGGLPSGITASKSGNTVSVTATANSSTSSGRSGSFTVTHSGDSSKSDSATVTQDKKDDITTKTEYQYEFSVSPTSLSFSADGGTKTISVTSRRRPVTLTYTNGSLTDESAGSWSAWSSYSGRISSGTGFSVSGTSVTAGANGSTSTREGNLELTQTQTSDYSGSTSSYKSDSSSLNVPLDQMGADIKPVNFIHLSYSWQSKDGAYDIYSVYASASYKVASTVIVECRLTYGSSLGAGAENYAFTISSGSTTSSARKCYTFAGDYPGVVSGTGSVRPSEDETYRYSFLE